MPASTLFLLLRLGADRYAIDSDVVVEVLPIVRLKNIPCAPTGVVGMMSFRGRAIPVVDLSTIALGTATPSRMMTRIVVVRYEPAAVGDGAGLLGLLVPEVMQTAHFDSSRFAPAGIRNDRAPYLGPVLTTDDGVLQQVLVAALLSEELRDALYHSEVAA
jgi:chemotaxis-related protein WspB